MNINQIIDREGLQEALSYLPRVESADEALREFAHWNADQVQHLTQDPRSASSVWQERVDAAKLVGFKILTKSKTDPHYSAWLHEARRTPEWNAAWCATRALQPGNAGEAAWAAAREADAAIGTEAFRQSQEAELRRVFSVLEVA